MIVAMGGGLSEAREVLSVTMSPEPTCQDSTMCATSRKPPRNLALPLQFSRPVCETLVVKGDVTIVTKVDFMQVGTVKIFYLRVKSGIEMGIDISSRQDTNSLLQEINV